MSHLRIERLNKSFGSFRAVEDIDLEIAEGSFVCFLGPSGCGKTTLMRIIAGLEQPSGGRIMVRGADITRKHVHERNFAMIFQSLALFPHLNVADNIAYTLRMRGVPRMALEARVDELLALVDLPDIGRRRVDELSGGQKQRVAIARALAQDPTLFLMDEPFSALDAKLRDHLQIEIRSLQKTLNITTIFVTHDQREAMTIADVIVVMADGRIQQVGTPNEVYRRPANAFVAGFIGRSNLLPVEIADARTVSWKGRPITLHTTGRAAAADQHATLCARPENLALSVPDGANDALLAQIDLVREVGSEVEVHLRCAGERLLASITPAVWERLQGQRELAVTFDPARCVVL